MFKGRIEKNTDDQPQVFTGASESTISSQHSMVISVHGADLEFTIKCQNTFNRSV